jgi:uncharacterized protein YbbC (DUF1343 family)
MHKFKSQLSCLCSIFLLFIVSSSFAKSDNVEVGANQFDQYLPMLNGKKVAILMNQTSIVGDQLLLDTLLKLQVDMKKIFVPEHGFRGTADAGAHVKNEVDPKTGLPVISLYGKNKKPTSAQLSDIDVVLYDLQDVGVRFYTYISSLEYLMDACIENNKMLIVLDRPNPNAHIVDGPVLEDQYKSFVGMQKIPVLYGLTVGEYAKMLIGEQWVKNAKSLNYVVIPCKNYNHNSIYTLPVAPSPNLKNMASIYYYPSLCFFEGTNVSVGRGTMLPFQQYGHPDFSKQFQYFFVPKSSTGATKPLLEGKKCYGELLDTNWNVAKANMKSGLQLKYLISAYENTASKTSFFNSFFDKLAGNSILKQQIIEGKSEKEIRLSWQKDLISYKKIRNKYLIYPRPGRS